MAYRREARPDDGLREELRDCQLQLVSVQRNYDGLSRLMQSKQQEVEQVGTRGIPVRVAPSHGVGQRLGLPFETTSSCGAETPSIDVSIAVLHSGLGDRAQRTVPPPGPSTAAATLRRCNKTGAPIETCTRMYRTRLYCSYLYVVPCAQYTPTRLPSLSLITTSMHRPRRRWPRSRRR